MWGNRSVIGEESCRGCGEVEADDRLCRQLKGEVGLECQTGTKAVKPSILLTSLQLTRRGDIGKPYCCGSH